MGGLRRIMREAALELEKVSKAYRTGGLKVEALRDVNLRVLRGEMTCIMGPSGSGKTTLLKVSSGLLRPDSGMVILLGLELYSMELEERVNARRRLTSFMFQEDLLIDTLSIRENVELPLILEGYPRRMRDEAVDRALEEVGLGGLGERRPMEVSGGERRRVSLARCLVKSPMVIFADEPTSNLDTETAEAMFNLLKDINKNGATVIFTTHDPRIARLAGNVITMRDGKIQGEFKWNTIGVEP